MGMRCNDCGKEQLPEHCDDSSLCKQCKYKLSDGNKVIKGKVSKEIAIQLMLRSCDWSPITDYAGRDENNVAKCEAKYDAAHDGDVLCEFKG